MTLVKWLIAGLLAALASLGTVTPAAAQDGRGYILGPDDTISVTVFGQPEAGTQTRIKPDGTIVMPLIGNVQAAGQTVISLADLITKKLTAGGFFKQPFVNVEVGG